MMERLQSLEVKLEARQKLQSLKNDIRYVAVTMKGAAIWRCPVGGSVRHTAVRPIVQKAMCSTAPTLAIPLLLYKRPQEHLVQEAFGATNQWQGGHWRRPIGGGGKQKRRTRLFREPYAALATP